MCTDFVWRVLDCDWYGLAADLCECTRILGSKIVD
jgi:hypothetical protein